MNNKGSDEVEFVVDFWGKFKNYVQEVEKKEDPEKWKKLQELDARRTKHRKGTLEILF